MLSTTDTTTMEDLDAVVGVDTHRDTHTAALTDPVGRQLATLVVQADADGYQQLQTWADQHAPGAQLLWAVEGARRADLLTVPRKNGRRRSAWETSVHIRQRPARRRWADGWGSNPRHHRL